MLQHELDSALQRRLNSLVYTDSTEHDPKL